MSNANPQTVTVVAYVRAKPGKEQEVKEALLALIPTTRQEPGCINYDLHCAAEDPALFMFHENWKSKADLDAHLQKPHLQDFMAKAEALLAEPPSITLWHRIG